MRPNRFRSESGSALVELAIALPVLVLILVATIDFARVFYLGIALTNAARAGAQWGAHNVAQSGDTAQMETVARNAILGTGAITASASRSCACATDAGVFGLTTPVNDCTGYCASNGHVIVTVTVTTSAPFNRVIPGVPGLPGSLTLTRRAAMRVAN